MGRAPQGMVGLEIYTGEVVQHINSTLEKHIFWHCFPTNQIKRIPALPQRKAGAWQAEMPLSKIYSFFDQKSKLDQKNSQAWHRSEDGRVCGPIPCLIYVCNLKPIEH